MRINYRILTLQLLLIIINIKPVFSQLNNWDWVKSAENTIGNNNPFSMCISPSNDIFISGLYTEFFKYQGEELTTDPFITHTYILGIDNLGNLNFLKSITGVGRAIPITMSYSNSLYISGNYVDTIRFDNFQLNNWKKFDDIFISKLNTDHHFEWVKSMNGQGWDNIFEMKVIDNRIYYTGTFTSDSIYFGNTLLQTKNKSLFLLKSDTAGNILKAINNDSNDGSQSNCITLDNDKNIYLAGHIEKDSVKFWKDSIINPGYFLAKFDTNLNIIWSKVGKRTLGKGINTIVSLTTDNLGNVYVLGQYFYEINLGNITLKTSSPDASNNMDYFIAKFDKNGKAIWAKTAKGINYEYPLKIVKDSKNYLYILCNTSSKIINFGSDSLVFKENDPFVKKGMFIVQYDTSGKINGFTNIDKVIGSNIITDARGYIYITGSYSDTVNFNNKYLYGTNNTNTFIAKLIPSTSSINTISNNTNAINIYPNPTSNGKFIIESQIIQKQNIEIEIFNSVGTLIYTYNIRTEGNLHKEVDLSSNCSGIYYLKIINKDSNHISYEKIIITK